MLECPTPLMGRELMSKLGACLTFTSHPALLAFPLMVIKESTDHSLEELAINSMIWEIGVPGQAIISVPIQLN
jgi:hypothetical protein